MEIWTGRKSLACAYRLSRVRRTSWSRETPTHVVGAPSQKTINVEQGCQIAFQNSHRIQPCMWSNALVLGERVNAHLPWVQHTEKFWNIFSQTFWACSFSVVATTEKEHSGSKRLGKYIETFQCAELMANGNWLFHPIPPYFSALRQLALVKQ